MTRACALLTVAMIVFLAWAAPAPCADQDKKTPAPVQTYKWTGFYVGVNAGYGFGSNSVDLGAPDSSPSGFSQVLAAGGAPWPGNLSAGGFVGGAQAGYNYQFDNYWVAGFEADLQYASIRDSSTVTAPPPPGFVPGITTVRQNISWLDTIRPRIGRLVTDRVLLYGTGGIAFAGVDRSATLEYPQGGNFNPGVLGQKYYGSSGGTKTGWTVGGGVEWAFAKKLSLKAEYLYYDLGNETVGLVPDYPGSPPGTLLARFHTTGQIVRTGLNYKF